MTSSIEHLDEFTDRLHAHLTRLVRAGADPTPDDLDAALSLAMPVPSKWAQRLGPVYRTGQLQRLLPGVGSPPITDEAVRDRRRAGRLIGVRTADGRWVWPAWQFDRSGARLVPSAAIIDLWRMLPWEAGNPLELVSWMTGRRRDLDGASPVDYVRGHGLDERVCRAASRIAARATV